MTQILLRRGPAAEWTTDNPILGPAEVGVELDTGKFKIGNGTVQWNNLLYSNDNAIAQAIAAHEAKDDPHPGYLTPAEGNAAYDPKGTAAAGDSAHVAAADPHTQYLKKTDATTIYIEEAELTTKGDVLIRDSTSSKRLPVGLDSLVLTANSKDANGVTYLPAPSADNALLRQAALIIG